MISKSRIVFICLSLVTVSCVVVGSMLAATTQGDARTDSMYKYLSVFTEVLGLVERAYVEETDVDKLMAGAFEGTADALDPFSLYVPAARVEEFEAARRVGGGRSGMLVLKERGTAYVVAVEAGGPAAAAGLEPGDILSTLQGRSTRQMPLWQIWSTLAGQPGSRVRIERLRYMEKAQVELELRDFERPAVVLSERRGVPVLRLGGFGPSTVEDVRKGLETHGGESIASPADSDKLVLDLRGLAGGDPGVAYDVAALFADGELGELRSRETRVEAFQSERPPRWHGRLVVLIDRSTQGPAEVLAAVLAQRLDAVLVGQRSFGHAGRQTLVPLSNGGRLQITDAFYTGPDRQPLHRPLQPDLRVAEPTFDANDKDPDQDLILDRGVEVLLGEREVPVAEAKQAA